MRGRANSMVQGTLMVFVSLTAFTQSSQPQFRQPVRVLFTDQGGKPLKNADVHISSPFGLLRGSTDAAGEYKLPGVAPGRYEIDVRFGGWVFERTIAVEQGLDGRVVVNGQVIEPGTVYNQAEAVIEVRLELKGSPSQPPPPTEAPPGYTPPPPEYTQPPSAHLERLFWNMWLEGGRRAPQFHPAAYLNFDEPYSLIVDLSALEYKKQPGTFTSEVGGTLQKLLQATTASQLNVDLYLLYDQRYFAPLTVEEAFQDFPISVAKIREVKQDSKDISGDISVESMRDAQYDRFRFGRAIFPLRTNRKAGTTFLGLSVWFRGVPIEEITWPSVCVKAAASDECPEAPMQATTLGGIDSAMLVALERAKQPAPALAVHFIDFDARGTAIVLKCNDCTEVQRYFSWRVSKPLPDLAKELKDSILSGIDTSAQTDDPKWLERAGEAISDLIFYGDDKEASDEARQRVAQLMGRATQGNVPSLFVRSISKGYDPLFLFPIGLAAIRVNGEPEHVGYHFRVESPLAYPDYKIGGCVSAWKVLLPKGTVDDALKQGLNGLQPGLSRLGQNIPECSDIAAKACTFTDMDAFASWVRNDTPGQPSTALLILSHHDHNRIYWDIANTVPASLFNAQFQSPSVVLFNACGTAKPEETELLRRLNQNGISSVIATYSEVPGYMAGRFSSLLIDILSDRKDDTNYSLSQAVYAAAMRLRDEPIPVRPGVPSGRKYGAFSLLFALVGNGGVRLCVP